MRKIFNILVILGTVILASPVFACSNFENGQMTGAACSIKELQKQQETKVQYSRKDSQSQIKSFRIMPSTIQNPDSSVYDCLFGKCLYRQIIKDTTNMY